MQEVPSIVAVHKSERHTLSKYTTDHIEILAGLGVQGDAHMGVKVKHRSRVAKDPSQPNLRQVHLIHNELLGELQKEGFHIKPGQMGENITTTGIDILNLPTNTILRLGATCRIKITGLRNPCSQLNTLQPNLMNKLVFKDDNGNLIRKAGIMAIVIEGGSVYVGDLIEVTFPKEPHAPLQPV